MVRLLIALVIAAHGVGHSLGLLQVLRIATVNPAWKGDSWLLTGGLGDGLAQLIGAALWAGALVGFLIVAGVIAGWLPGSWWPFIAVVAAALSLAGLALFPTAFPLTSTIGALVIDLGVLAAVVLHWLPADLPA
jgi:hypothetical protein